MPSSSRVRATQANEGQAGQPGRTVGVARLLARALDSAGLAESDLGGVINTSDADMIAAFATPDVQAVVTWNSLVSAILADPTATSVFDPRTSPARTPT